MKKCLHCKIEQSTDNFCKDRTNSDGLQTYCKACHKAFTKRWRLENPTAYREKCAKNNRKARESGYIRNWRLKKEYGISKEQYDDMLIDQKGQCSICRSTSSGTRGKSFHVDHNHQTGKVRGLLCADCNHGIGFFHDSPVIMEKAIRYLISNSIMSKVNV